MIQNALSFVAVVKAGSFTTAAQNLGVSKAQLSRHVSQLEEKLGIQLLYRTTRSINLTESGERFFVQCKDLEENYETAIESLKTDFHGLTGNLKITAPISFGSEFLPIILQKFIKKHPNIKIILSLSSITEDLIEKNFDLSIRIAPSLPDSSLKMLKIMELELLLCAAPNFFIDQPIPPTFDMLKNYKCITSVNRNPELSKIYWSFYQGKKIIKFAPTSCIEVDSIRAQIQLVLAGVGIGRLPRLFIEKELEEEQLIEILPQIKKPKLNVYLLYPNRPILPKKIQVFIDLMKELKVK